MNTANSLCRQLLIALLILFIAAFSGACSKVTHAKSNLKSIFQFGFAAPAATGVINEQTKTIDVTVPFGTNVTALTAAFATTGRSVSVNGVEQFSGATKNDFTGPVPYLVTADNGSTATYTVAVTQAPSSAKAMTAFSFVSPAVSGTINESAKTITVLLPYGTNTVDLKANFATTGQSVAVNGTTQVSGTTANDFTTPVLYKVTAADGSTTDYTVTVLSSPGSAKAITLFAFTSLNAYGSINEATKTIDVTVLFATNLTGLVATYATTGQAVTVNNISQSSGATVNDFTTPVNYIVTAADGSTATYTVTVTVAANSAKAITAFTFANPAATGVINEAGKSINVVLPYGSTTIGLVASFATSGNNVTVGGTTQVSGVTANDFMTPVPYVVTAANGSTATYLVTVLVAPSSAKYLTAFSFPTVAGASGTIDEAAKTVAMTVPFGTSVTALTAAFTSTGAAVKVGGVVQSSGVSANNFTNPVSYQVIAGDGTSVAYTVTVVIAPNSEKYFIGYAFPSLPASGTIGNVNHTVDVSAPSDTNVTALVASFTLPFGATATVNGVAQFDGVTLNDFSAPVSYVITAQDGTQATWTVTVTLGPPQPTTWSALSSQTAGNFTSVAWSGTQFVAVTDTGEIYASPSGDSAWTKVLASIGATPFTDVYCEPALVVCLAVGAQGVTRTSTDWGTTWVANGNITMAYARSVTYSTSFSTWIAVGDSGQLYTSYDGIQWSTATTNTSETLWAVDCWGTKCGAVGNAGLLLGSMDLIGWYPLPAVTTNALFATAAVGLHGIAVGDAGTILGTSNGINWDLVSTGVYPPLRGASSTGVAVAAVGDGGTIITSLDGLSWTERASGTANTLRGVAWSPALSKMVAVGDAGTVSASNLTSTAPSSANDIVGFDFGGSAGIIDSIAKTVNVEIPYGQLQNSAVAHFTLSQYATTTVSGVPQASGVTANDFTGSVSYVVRAADGSTSIWVVTATPGLNSRAEFETFEIPALPAAGWIDLGLQVVYVDVPYGTDLTALVPTFTISGGATATVNGIPQESGTTPNDFSYGEVDYFITSQDGLSTVMWPVFVNVMPPSNGADILDFSLDYGSGVAMGSIDNFFQTIDVTLPQGTPVNSLISAFSLSPYATAYVGGVEQTSGVTVQDFTNPVSYDVQAQDGSIVTYTVYVTVLP